MYFQEERKADREKWKTLDLTFTQSQPHTKHGIGVSLVGFSCCPHGKNVLRDSGEGGRQDDNHRDEESRDRLWETLGALLERLDTIL